MFTKDRSFVIAKRTANVLGIIAVYIGISHLFARFVWLEMKFNYAYVQRYIFDGRVSERYVTVPDGNKTFWNYSPENMEDLIETHLAGAAYTFFLAVLLLVATIVYEDTKKKRETRPIAALKTLGFAILIGGLVHLAARVVGLYWTFTYYTLRDSGIGEGARYVRIPWDEKTLFNYAPESYAEVMYTHYLGAILILLVGFVLFLVHSVIFGYILKDIRPIRRRFFTRTR